MVAGWAVPQTYACGLGVLLGLIPAPTAQGRSIPVWLDIMAILVGISAPLGALLVVPLSIVSFHYLHRVMSAGRVRMSAWAVAMAVGIVLETILVVAVLRTLVPQGVSYPIPAQLSWGWIALGAGFAATAATMTWVLISSTNSKPPVDAALTPAT
jgi:hypothetical protein